MGHPGVLGGEILADSKKWLEKMGVFLGSFFCGFSRTCLGVVCVFSFFSGGRHFVKTWHQPQAIQGLMTRYMTPTPPKLHAHLLLQGQILPKINKNLHLLKSSLIPSQLLVAIFWFHASFFPNAKRWWFHPEHESPWPSRGWGRGKPRKGWKDFS